MNTTVFAFDIDGTLINHAGFMHPDDRKILETRKDLILIPSTGRTLHSFKRSLQSHGLLLLDQLLPMPFIALNGSLIYKQNEKLEKCFSFNGSEKKTISATIPRFPRVSFFFMGDNEIFLCNPTPIGDQFIEKYELNILRVDGISDRSFGKVMCVSDHNSELEHLEQVLTNLPAEKVCPMPSVFELTPIGVDKGSSLLKLLYSMGISNPHIYAAGDGGNDLAMLQKATRSFAPLTSPDAIKNSADQLIDWEITGLLSPMLIAAGVE